MFSSNTETGITATYQDADGTIDLVVGTLNQDTSGNAATATALETARNIGGVSFDGTANINLPGVNTAGNQNTSGTAALATTVTVTDSTANTNFPVVFHDESNGLLDDTGALRYNPSTGTLLVPNLNVAGTTTTVDTVTMEAANAIVFEGATSDTNETTLTITDPTADRTITLPDATGTVALTSQLSDTQLTTEEVQDIVGAMFSSNTETRITATYQDGDGTIDLVVDDMTADTNTNQLTTFTLTGDSGSNQTIAHGNTLDIAGGDGIATVVGSTDTVTVGLDIDGMTDIGAALVDADLMIVDDGAGGTNRKATMSRLKTYMQNNLTFTTDTNQQTTFTLTGDSGSNQTIAHGNTLDVAGGTGISTTVGATDTVTVALDAAQTGITSILNSSLAIGRDAHNQIQFSTDNEIHFKTNNETPVIKMKASGEIEATSLDISGDVDVDGTLEADAITLGGTAVAVSGGAFHDGFSDFVANEHIDHSGVSIVAGDGLTGGGTIASSRTLAVGAGTGIDVAADAISVDVSDFMTNGSNNRVLTATGTDAMNAEANLTFDGDTLSVTTSGTSTTLLLESTDSGASDAPILELYRNSSSPANTDDLGQILWSGEKSDGSKYSITKMYSQINTVDNSDRLMINVASSGGSGLNNYEYIRLDGGVRDVIINEGGQDIDFRIEGDSDTALFFTDASSDRIGIGTTSPTTKLDVSGSITVADDIIHSGDTNNKIAFGTDTQSFQTGGTARFNISDSGLQIGSGARVTTIITQSDGIGSNDNETTLPTSAAVKDYVDNNAGGGGASVANDLTDAIVDITNFVDGFLLQTDSDGSAPTTGTLNNATGNIGLGKDVFEALTTGDYNVGLGYDALESLTTGSGNIALGYRASFANETGSDSVAIGRSALYNSTSSNTVAIGYSAGYSQTSGNNNVAVGYEAIYGDDTNQYNVAVGYRAFRQQGGGGNIAIGAFSQYGAGATNTGNYNTSVGRSSLADITSGDENTVMGYEAGKDVNSGASNILIGYTAGDNITSGSNNLVIGDFQVDVATGDDQIIIGSGDGGVTWLKGDSNGIKALKIKVKAVSSNTTLTDAQSGSYVYWTGGTLTLPATAESGQQYTIINNTGGSATPSLGTSNAIASGWTAHAAMADETARTYVSVASNKWIYIG
jgi:hypothetical protein